MPPLCNFLHHLQHEDGRQPVNWQPGFQLSLHILYYFYYTSNRGLCQYEYIHSLKYLLGVLSCGVFIHVLFSDNGETIQTHRDQAISTRYF